jgi:chemotaxis signal transduction protein
MDMEETRLLLFCLKSEEYGVPVEDVSGIVRGAGINELSPRRSEESHGLQDRIPVLDAWEGLTIGAGKTALILNFNGIQVALVVDEVTKEVKLEENALKSATIGIFTLWKIN